MSAQQEIFAIKAAANCSFHSYKENTSDFNGDMRKFTVGSNSFTLVKNKSVNVLAFRGSNNLQNWWDNCRKSLVPYYGRGSNANARVHDDDDAKVHEGIQETFRNLLNVLIQEVTRFFVNKRKHLVICGHSLGGAFAILAALEFVDRGYKHFSLITFGAPSIGNLKFNQLFHATEVENFVDQLKHTHIYKILGNRHGCTATYYPFEGQFDVVPRLRNLQNLIQSKKICKASNVGYSKDPLGDVGVDLGHMMLTYWCLIARQLSVAGKCRLPLKYFVKKHPEEGKFHLEKASFDKHENRNYMKGLVKGLSEHMIRAGITTGAPAVVLASGAAVTSATGGAQIMAGAAAITGNVITGLPLLGAAPGAVVAVVLNNTMYDTSDPTLTRRELTKRNAGRVGTVAGAVVGTVGSFATLATVGAGPAGLAAIGGTMLGGIGAIVAAPAIGASALGYALYCIGS